MFFILISIDHYIEISEIFIECDLDVRVSYKFIIISVHNCEHPSTKEREYFHSKNT